MDSEFFHTPIKKEKKMVMKFINGKMINTERPCRRISHLNGFNYFPSFPPPLNKAICILTASWLFCNISKKKPFIIERILTNSNSPPSRGLVFQVHARILAFF